MKSVRLLDDIYPRRRFFANFNRPLSSSLAVFLISVTHTPMRFFISPADAFLLDSRAVPLRRRIGGETAAWGWWESKKSGGRKGSGDIFNYKPEVAASLAPTTRHQLPNISGVSLDASPTPLSTTPPPPLTLPLLNPSR